MEQDLDDICDALEAMIDAADDAWEAERMCLVKVKETIKQEKYEPAKEMFRRALDRYIDNRIRKYHNRKEDSLHYDFNGDYDL